MICKKSMRIISNSRVKRNLHQKDRHVRQVQPIQVKALRYRRHPLSQKARLPLHRQTVWQEAVRHREAVLLQEALLMDHPAAPHQEAVRHPEQQPDRRTLHSNLSRMRYAAEKRAFQQLTAYPAQKRLHMEK